MNLAETARRRLENAKKVLEALTGPESASAGSDARSVVKGSQDAREIVEKIEEQHRLQEELLGDFKSVSALESCNGELQGKVRALEFTKGIFSERRSELEKRLGAEGLNMDELGERFNRASEEEPQLAEAVEAAERELSQVRDRCTVKYLSESELEGLRAKNLALTDRVKDLEYRIKVVTNSRAKEEEIENEKLKLEKDMLHLVSELGSLEQYQNRVCESRMDNLGFAIEKEELVLAMLAKQRELVEITQYKASSLDTIPEDYLAVNFNFDFESGDIDDRQAQLRTLHDSVREANEVREALHLRVLEVESELRKLT